LVVCSLAWVLSPSSANADPRDPAAAQALFDEGLALMKQRAFTQACPKLAESQRLDPGIGTQFHMAECYEQQGLLASAWAQYLEVASVAAAAGQTSREQVARKRAARLEPHLARIRVIVPFARRVPALRIERDGSAVGEAQWDVAVPVDAGEHTITVVEPGAAAISSKVQVADGQTKPYELPALVPVAEQPAAVPVAVAAPPPAPTLPPAPVPTTPTPMSKPPPAELPPSPMVEPARGSGLSALFIGLGAAGVLGVGVGSALAIAANSKLHSSQTHCRASDDHFCDAQGVKERDQAVSLANAATVGFVVGGAALGAAVLTLVLREGSGKPAATASPGQMTASVTGTATQAALLVQGTF